MEIKDRISKKLEEAKSLSDEDRKDWYKKIRGDLMDQSSKLAMVASTATGSEKVNVKKAEKAVDSARKILFDLI